MSLLIVEDDRAFVDVMREMLELKDVRFAHSIREARSLIDQSAPEIIILDLSLPDSSSQETIDRIRELKTSSKDATVIVITGHHNPERFKDQAIAQGAACILSKDRGFFAALEGALLLGARRKKGEPQGTVEKIERTVSQIVGPDE